MPVFDVKSYRESLKTKYNIPDEDLAALGDKGEITQGFMRQDDYSRKQRALQEQQTQVQQQYQHLSEYETWVKSLEAQYGPREQWSAAFSAQVQRQDPAQSMSPDDITRIVQANVQAAIAEERKAFQQQLEQVGQGSAAFARFYYQSNKDWESKYGTPLPEDEFKKYYEDNGHTDPRIALQLFERPFAEKKKEEEWQKKLDAAREEGVRSAMSQGYIPEAGSGGTMGSMGGWYGADQRMSVGANAGGYDPKQTYDGEDKQKAMQEFSARLQKSAQTPSRNTA